MLAGSHHMEDPFDVTGLMESLGAAAASYNDSDAAEGGDGRERTSPVPAFGDGVGALGLGPGRWLPSSASGDGDVESSLPVFNAFRSTETNDDL